jgi:hypothetical protein
MSPKKRRPKKTTALGGFAGLKVKSRRLKKAEVCKILDRFSRPNDEFDTFEVTGEALAKSTGSGKWKVMSAPFPTSGGVTVALMVIQTKAAAD